VNIKIQQINERITLGLHTDSSVGGKWRSDS